MKFFVLLFIVTTAECLHLQLFNQSKYRNFTREFILSAEEEKSCVKVMGPDEINLNMETAMSIKTDKCVMLYQSHACNANAWSWRIDKNTPTIDQDTITTALNPSKGFAIGAFHVCSQELGGGPMLDVDLYSMPMTSGEVLAKYRNLCGCQNIPYSLTEGESQFHSLTNYGNGLAIFEKEHCEPPYTYVPPGTTILSNYLTNNSDIDEDFTDFIKSADWGSKNFYTYLKDKGFPTPPKVHSFYPMGTLNCAKLDASVFRFEFKNDSKTPPVLDFEDVAISLESVFRNNGSAKITQEYTASQRVKESLEISKATGWSNVHTVKLEGSVETTAKFDIPLLASGEAKFKIGASYQWQGTHSGSDTERKVNENEETFSIRQGIEIPPCYEYRVKSFLKMVKNYTIDYTAFAKLTGMAGDTIMNKNELKINMGPGMDFVRDLDDHAIEVSVKGQMFAKYGVKTFIVGDGNPIKDCKTNTNGAKNDKLGEFIIEVPFHKG